MSATDTAKRTCTETTRKGEPCKGTPLAGLSVCMAHAPKEVRESRGFGGAQEGAGRKRNPRPSEVLRDRLDEKLDAVLGVYFEALTATRHVVVGNGPSAYVEEVPDIPTRLRAADAILDRVEGKPRQAHELTGKIEHADSDPFAKLDREQFIAEVGEFLAEHAPGIAAE